MATTHIDRRLVTPRERRVSRNRKLYVTPRERRVSRNICLCTRHHKQADVTPRERRVSRNAKAGFTDAGASRHASREACE